MSQIPPVLGDQAARPENDRATAGSRLGAVSQNASMHKDPLSPASNPAVDAITLEVIRHGLVAIANQIDANIKRTAFSPYIYEYNDFAVGLTDAHGQLIAQCTGGMPPFVADSVGIAVRDKLKIYGSERLDHGDVVLCNHAAVQGHGSEVRLTPRPSGA